MINHWGSRIQRLNAARELLNQLQRVIIAIGDGYTPKLDQLKRDVDHLVGQTQVSLLEEQVRVNRHAGCFGRDEVRKQQRKARKEGLHAKHVDPTPVDLGFVLGDG